MKSSNSGVYSFGGNSGGSPFTTAFNCSNGVPHVGNGNLPVANSISDMPKLQTSDRISYCDGLPCGSILSG